MKMAEISYTEKQKQTNVRASNVDFRQECTSDSIVIHGLLLMQFILLAAVRIETKRILII